MHTAFINDVFAGNTARAFCWMLVHSLWQGLLFTIITGVVLLATKKSSAALRYNIMCTLLCLFLAVCAATFVWELRSAGAAAAAGIATITPGVAQNILKNWMRTFNGYFSANAGIILTIWLAVFVARCVKMTASLVYSQRVRHHKTYTPTAEWRQKMAALCTQLKLQKKVQLVESGLVKIPVVIGHLKPIVFIPLGLLTSLPAGEIEAVLLHELAHIRRNDYLVNIIQVIAENVFFFNPALLWMSAVIREEREHCCDDVAVAETKSKKQFIQALVSFKEHALHTGRLSTAFPAKKNQLLQRVSRIVNSNNKALSSGEKVFFVASFVMLTLLVVGITGNSQAVAEKQVQQGALQPLALPVSVTAGNNVVAKNSIAVKPRQRLNEAKASSKQPVVIAYYRKVVTADESPEQQEITQDGSKKNTAAPMTDEEKQAVMARDEAEQDRLQAEEDRKQADADRQQAEEDRKQALKDQEQARLDQIQADKDREQAELDRKQAELDRQQSQKDKPKPVKTSNSKPA